MARMDEFFDPNGKIGETRENTKSYEERVIKNMKDQKVQGHSPY